MHLRAGLWHSVSIDRPLNGLSTIKQENIRTEPLSYLTLTHIRAYTSTHVSHNKQPSNVSDYVCTLKLATQSQSLLFHGRRELLSVLPQNRHQQSTSTSTQATSHPRVSGSQRNHALGTLSSVQAPPPITTKTPSPSPSHFHPQFTNSHPQLPIALDIPEQ